MLATGSCPTCGGPALQPTGSTPRVALCRCQACGHRVARHIHVEASGDYHTQYGAGTFLAALAATRQRQARVIIARAHALQPSATTLLDLGCGRGWFLDTARSAGLTVAGADSSSLAVQLVRERGIPGVLLANDELPPSEALPFRPAVVTLLDVVEHFAPERIVPLLTDLRERFRPDLSLVVIKVPVSSGLLYQVAAVLARAGSPGLLEQLYQAGTDPPHRSYFSMRSARAALVRAGFDVLEVVRDLDFEPGLLAQRAQALRRVPPRLVSAVAYVLAGTATTLRAEDSTVLFAAPR